MDFSVLQNIYKNRFFRVFLLFGTITLIGAALVLIFEVKRPETDYQNLWDSIWWAIVTIFTVGYGDKTPVTVGGRLIAILVMVAGIYLVSLITATISSIFVAKKIREDRGLETINYDNHLILCGWNDHAEAIIDHIFSIDPDKHLKLILVNELPEEQINSILDKFRKYKVKFIRGDYTRHAPLERASIGSASAVILLPNLDKYEPTTADEKTLLATLNIKTNFPKLKVIAFIMNPENEVHVRRAKADEIFISDQFTDFIIASNVLKPGLADVVAELLSPHSEHLLTTVEIPARFIHKPFQDLFQAFKKQHGYLTLGLVSELESVGISDFLSADTSHLDAFIERKLMEAGKGLEEENKVFVNINPADDYIIQENERAVIIK